MRHTPHQYQPDRYRKDSMDIDDDTTEAELDEPIGYRPTEDSDA